MTARVPDSPRPEHQSREQPSRQAALYQSPVRLLIVLLLSVFAVEAFVMLLLAFLPPLPAWAEAFLDAVLLSALLFPVLYFVAFRTLVAHIGERQSAEENVRHLLEQSVRQAEDLALLNETGQLLASTLDLQAIFEQLTRRCVEVFEVDSCLLRVVEDDCLAVKASCFRDPRDGEELLRLLKETPLRVGEGIAGRVVETGEAAVSGDAPQEELTLSPFVEYLRYRHWMVVPMKTKGRVIGVLTLMVRQEERPPFEERERILTDDIANGAVMALENALLFGQAREAAAREQARAQELELLAERLSIASEESDRLATQLAALNRLDHIISSSLDLNEIYRAFAAESQKIISFDRVSVALVEGDQVRVFATEIGVKTTVGAEAVLSLKGGTVEAVIESGQPLIRHDLIAEERYPEDRELIAAGLRSGVLVPLAAKGRMLGTFDVASCQVNAYAEKDLPLLQSLADQLVIAIENAGLHQKVLASEQEYRTLVENATEFIWTMDTEGRFTFGNRQSQEVSGHKITDWIGKSFAPVIAPPEDLPRIQQIVLEALAGKPQSYEVGIYRADGSIIYLSVNTKPLYRDGEVVGTISFGRDVTAQQEAEAALTQRMAELSSLFEVSSALRGVEGVEYMLPVIVDKAVEVCRADCGSVSLVDESGETLITRYGTGARQALVGARLRLGQDISGRVAQSGTPHLSPDFQHDPLLAFDPATSARLPEIASDVCVPLRVGEQIVGAMHVSTYAAWTCTKAEIRLLTAIADMAASAIRRAGLLEQLEHRVRELSALFDVGKMATTSLRIEDVLQFVAGAATEAVHAEGSYLFLWDEREERLALRASQGLLAEDVGRRKYRLGEGLAGWVFLERQVVNAPDLSADPRWKREPEQEAPLASGRANSALIVPLVIGKKALGVLGVINKIGAPVFSTSNESLLTALAGQIAIAIENARLYEDVRDLSVAAIRSLATAIDARDPYTRGHSEGVTHLAVKLARELGWNGADLEMLEFAALLHDAGKIAVPDAVLRKVEPLTADEWTIIRLHPYHSAQIVKPVESLQRIVPWVYHHQERWDGTGYPDGLKGEAIPLASRLIAVADAFNAMTTNRPYRKALSRDDALAEIRRGAGKQFDPTVVEVFLRMIKDGGVSPEPYFPAGQRKSPVGGAPIQ